jgi:DNA-binding NarL/FixJ family response regulator
MPFENHAFWTKEPSWTAEHKPDIVLMTIQMPGLNGIEATRRIARENPGIGVVVVTMFEGDDSVFATVRAGARGYVLKGADADEVVKVVGAVAGGRGPLWAKHSATLDRLFSTAKPLPSEAFPELTAREAEVLDLIARGTSNQQIASRL